MLWVPPSLKACRNFRLLYRTCHRCEPVSDPGLFLAAGVDLQRRSVWLTFCAWSHSSLIEDKNVVGADKTYIYIYLIYLKLVANLKYRAPFPKVLQ